MCVLDQSVSVYKYFEQISKIPHGSFNEKQLSDYVVNFAEEHNLKYLQDDMGNVVIYKNASVGYENHDVVMLQGHMDMVCEKNKDTDFDFEKDSLHIYVEDGWLKAKGTTLGADDGVGIATMLAILEDKELKHPPLECVFTVQEEVGLFGSIHLKKEYFNAKKMIGLDGGGEVTTTITSSGGRYAYVEKKIDYEKNILPTYKLMISGLDGGHSGGCIDKEKGNSIKIAFRVLEKLDNIHLISVNGGLKENAIPRECEVVFSTDQDPIHDIQGFVEDLKTEFEFSDKNLSIQIEQIDTLAEAMSNDLSNEIIQMYYLFPNGFQHKSMAIEGLTVASLNLGKVRIEEDCIKCSFCIRSPMESCKDEMGNKIKMIANLCHAHAYENTNFPGWNYEENSPLRDKLKDLLASKGIEMETDASHGGMETGILKGLLPDLDIITYGPIAFGCHTPEEKLDLASFKRSYDNICKLLATL